jgi:hypothetical protein
MSPSSLLAAVLLAVSSVRLAYAATAQVFAPPSRNPLVQTTNYTSFSNHTLNDKKVVKGKVFSRIIQVWLENTDFEVRPVLDAHRALLTRCARRPHRLRSSSH